VPTVQEAGWASGPVWTGSENLAPTGILSPDRQARRQSLYQLHCPALMSIINLSISIECCIHHYVFLLTVYVCHLFRNTVQLIVNVEDVNDNAPVFLQSRYEARLWENHMEFESPFYIEAVDLDLNGKIICYKKNIKMLSFLTYLRFRNI
jgi:hypothetical protein